MHDKYALTYMQSGENIAYWQEVNFHAETMTFAGPGVTYHPSIRSAVEYVRTMNDALFTEGSGKLYPGPADGEPWALTTDSEPSHIITPGPQGGLKVERV